MIKPLYIVTIAASLVCGMGTLSADSLSPMHKKQQMHPDSLPRNQRVILHRLSPKYQQIYLYVLSADEREDVVAMYQKGDNPYRVINCMLQKERKYHKKYRNRYHVKKEVVYTADDSEMDEDDFAYQEESKAHRVKKKHMQKRKVATNNRSIESAEKKSSSNGFVQKCRSLYSSCKKEDNKKDEYFPDEKKPRCSACKRRRCSH